MDENGKTDKQVYRLLQLFNDENKNYKIKGTRPRTDMYVNEYKNEEEIVSSAITFSCSRVTYTNLLYSCS